MVWKQGLQLIAAYGAWDVIQPDVIEILILHIWVGASLQQQLDHTDIRHYASVHEWRLFFLVQAVDIGAGVEQNFSNCTPDITTRLCRSH